MEEKNQHEAFTHETKSSLFGRTMLTGFIGGLLWSLIGVFMYYFNFSELSAKSFLIRSWLRTDWTDTWLGDLVSIIMAGILSVLVAIVYYGLFKRINSMWMGVLYGILLWALVFYVLRPIFPNIPKLTDLTMNTIVSTLSLYIIYGTFIGYSISYDYHDTLFHKSGKANTQKQ